jgi:hypothetical protein
MRSGDSAECRKFFAGKDGGALPESPLRANHNWTLRREIATLPAAPDSTVE